MTDWYAPNQQAVRADGSGPAEEGTGGGGEPGGGTRAAGAFDPAEATVAEVQDYVTANPDQLEAVTQAETSGKNRSTLVDWLEAQSG